MIKFIIFQKLDKPCSIIGIVKEQIIKVKKKITLKRIQFFFFEKPDHKPGNLFKKEFNEHHERKEEQCQQEGHPTKPASPQQN